MKFSFQPRKSFAALLEFAGFFLILGAAIFQWMFTDWFTSEKIHYPFLISSEMQIHALQGIGSLALLTTVPNSDSKSTDAHNLQIQMSDAATSAILNRQHMDGPFARQGSFFSGVRLVIFGLGSIMIVVAKFVTFLVIKREEAEQDAAANP